MKKFNTKDYTIMLPVSNSDIDFSNKCLAHLLDNSTYNIVLIDDFGKDEDYIQNDRVSFIHNTFKDRQPLVKIWNQCIKECPTDNVIIASWRQRPTPQHFYTIEKKMKEGYGLVAFEGLHVFGFNKYLLSVIGFFDEGFTRGTYEDTDWFNRLFAKNIAIYTGAIDEERYSHGKYVHSKWLKDAHKNKKYYESKWIQNDETNELIQLKEEVNISDRNYFKNIKPIKYKPWKYSVLDSNLEKYFTILYKYINKINYGN